MEIDKNTSDPSQTATPPPPKSGLLARLKSSKRLMTVAILVVLVVVAGAIFILTKDDARNQKSGASNTTGTTGESSENTAVSMFMQQYGQNCKQRDVAFTSPPMKMTDLGYIRPLGAVSDGHVTPTDHVYIGSDKQPAAPNAFPVLMPADGTILEVSAMPSQYIGDRQGQQTADEDHRIVVGHSCRYFSIYIHINKLSDKLKEAVGTLQPNEGKQTTVELKAGDVIGYIGNSTFDWTPIDTTVRLPGFITPSRYDGESWKIHTISPFDLYTGSLKAELEAKSLRSVPPLGGRIDYDQPGKLIGNWFQEGTGGYSGQNQNGGRYWDGHLSVAPDYIDPLSTIVSIGNWTGTAKQFVVSGSVDPAAITQNDGVVKYELKRLSYVPPNGQISSGNTFTKGLRPTQDNPVEGTIIFQVMAGEKLKVEKFPGKTAAQVSGFTNAALMYER